MYSHTTVLKDEAIHGLNMKKNGIYVDGTLGGAGHSREIVKQLTEDGHLYAFDRDATALEAARRVLAPYEGKFTLIHENFRHVKRELLRRGVTRVDGILLDLGVSSPQLDEKERGFSYRHDAPLDMRMDRSESLTAYEIVNEWPYERLVRILFRYGEEKFSKQIARKIEISRKNKPIETTGQLAEIVKEAIPAPARRKGGHPAKRTFQAIRIAVNDELEALEEALSDGLSLLAAGGRMCVITFHSLEDRIVKKMFKKAAAPPQYPPGLPVVPEKDEPNYTLITKKPIIPGKEEQKVNHRARSAKLRVIEKKK